MFLDFQMEVGKNEFLLNYSKTSSKILLSFFAPEWIITEMGHNESFSKTKVTLNLVVRGYSRYILLRRNYK